MAAGINDGSAAIWARWSGYSASSLPAQPMSLVVVSFPAPESRPM